MALYHGVKPIIQSTIHRSYNPMIVLNLHDILVAMKWNCVSVCVCLHLLNNSINSDHFESAFAVQFRWVFKAYWPHLCRLCLQQNDLIALYPHHILSSHWSIHVKWCLLHSKLLLNFLLNYCEVPFCFTEITNYCHRLFLSSEGKFCVQTLRACKMFSISQIHMLMHVVIVALSVAFFYWKRLGNEV